MLTELAPSRWDGSGMPLASFPRLLSHDIDQVHHHMSEMFCPHDLRLEGGRPPIAFRHHHASLRSVSFSATDYGNPYGRVIVDIPPMDQLYLVQFSLVGAVRITQGKRTFELEPGHMCVLNPGERVQQVFGEGYKHFTVKLSKSGIEAALSQELGFKAADLRFCHTPVSLAGSAVSFAQLVRTICDDLDRGSSAFNHTRVVGSVEQALQRLLLAAVPHNHSELFNTPAAAPAPYYVRRVEEFIRHHAEDPITLDEMIAVSGVSARSLHTGFRRFRGTTPMAYLKNCRLSLAHRQLQDAAETGLTVTEVALSCGFTHLSKFARDYTERFGQRPSETLKRIGFR